MNTSAADRSHEEQFLTVLRREIPQNERSIWLDGIEFHISEDAVQITAPSKPQIQVIETRWSEIVRKAAIEIHPDCQGRVQYHFLESRSPRSRVADTETETYPKSGQPSQPEKLRPGLTFDHFITGPSNQLAHAAAIACAENPGNAYNPFFIHGSVGLGKTHLLQAIAHRLAERGLKKVIVISCASFTNEFISALSTQKIDRFREHYRSADALLIDDIQFLCDKERTQEEFFHTFNDIYNREQQIVLTSDAPPMAIEGLSERLVSRFRLGLVVQLEAPDLETRMAIVQRKMVSRNLELPQEVVEQIAVRIIDNVRELEGAVLRIESMILHEGVSATPDHVGSALDELFGTETRRMDLTTIEKTVCEYYSVTPEQLSSSRRTRSIVLPRQVCMFLGRIWTDCSLGEIGQHFGGRDHTTVMHSIDKIRTNVSGNATLRRDIESLEAALRQI